MMAHAAPVSEGDQPCAGPCRWPPVLRLAGGLATVAAALALPPTAYWAQAILLGIVLLSGRRAGVSLRTMLGRLVPLLVAGLVAFAALCLLRRGLPAPGARVILWSLLSKTGLAVLVFTALAGLLPGADLLQAMRGLRFPRPLRVVTYLALHWLGEIRERAHFMHQAAACRGEPHGRRRAGLAVALARALLLRCVWRADTIAFALCARGFAGDLPVVSRRAAAPGARLSFLAYCLLLTSLLWLAWSL